MVYLKTKPKQKNKAAVTRLWLGTSINWTTKPRDGRWPCFSLFLRALFDWLSSPLLQNMKSVKTRKIKIKTTRRIFLADLRIKLHLDFYFSQEIDLGFASGVKTFKTNYFGDQKNDWKLLVPTEVGSCIWRPFVCSVNFLVICDTGNSFFGLGFSKICICNHNLKLEWA